MNSEDCVKFMMRHWMSNTLGINLTIFIELFRTFGAK